jgi:1-acyl-sn-glycerol-3-phosphate acyltransferase
VTLRLVHSPSQARTGGGNRVALAGRRIAATGLSALAAAGRMRQLRKASSPEARRGRALLLRDFFGELVRVHRIEVQASGPIPLGPALLASNHVSYLDPIVVGSLVPCVPISKLDVAAWPVVGAFAHELGVLFVARGDRHSGMRVMRGAARAFAERLPVLNFPEGTTTTGGSVLPFQEGLFGLACRAGVPVVPVSLAYDPPIAAWVGDDSFLPHYFRIAGEERVRARLRFGAAIPHARNAGAAELARAAQTCVSEMLESCDVAAVGG